MVRKALVLALGLVGMAYWVRAAVVVWNPNVNVAPVSLAGSHQSMLIWGAFLLGTLSNIVNGGWVPIVFGSVVMLDKKTGKMQWISFATQLALYARTRAADWRTGATRPWHADLDPERGIVVSASLTSGEVKMYRVHTPSYLADSAVERYRLSLADHVKSLVSEGF